MDFKKKSTYHKLRACYHETYEPPVTISYPDWIRYITQGKNTLYGGAIIPGGTMDDGAVYQGHVRQNPWTAGVY